MFLWYNYKNTISNNISTMQNDSSQSNAIASQKIVKPPRETFLVTISWLIIIFNMIGMLYGFILGAGFFIILRLVSLLLAATLLITSIYSLIKNTATETNFDTYDRVRILAIPGIIVPIITFSSVILVLESIIPGRPSNFLTAILFLCIFIELIILVIATFVRLKMLQKAKTK